MKEDLRDRGVMFIENDRLVLDGKEIDIWIPEKNIGIEVNPAGTHSVDSNVGVSDKDYHQKKSLLAVSKGIALIHMYDEDFCDGEKYNKIMDLICMEPSVAVGARKCDLKPLDRSEANRFLDRYHLQGGEKASGVRYGLFYGDDVVAVMTAGKSRFAKADLEILRYCVHPKYAVSGGFMRLFTAVLSGMDDGMSIVSYMDLNKRFRSESIYEKAGFSYDGLTPPDYVWVGSKGDILKRYDTMKKKLMEQGYPADKSEKEIMFSRHYLRVFGAGSVRYVYTKNP